MTVSTTKLTYYWACEACGASPILAKNLRRWFAAPEDAIAAGKPERCSNHNCHGLDRHGEPNLDPIQIHNIPSPEVYLPPKRGVR